MQTIITKCYGWQIRRRHIQSLVVHHPSTGTASSRRSNACYQQMVDYRKSYRNERLHSRNAASSTNCWDIFVLLSCLTVDHVLFQDINLGC
ncbi:hypothetical protein RB195_000447 [Necator americanus]|uniref:Uncharacterized protein n=1 Tax=Necator americanus TaxID=51031 RepID=A0ABR1D9S8_NECAM